MLRATRLFLLVLWVALCTLLGVAALKFKKPRWRDHISTICFKIAALILRVKVTVRGGLSTARPLLLVSNHVSYLDVIILGSVFPFRFTPKQEIAGWGGISGCCRVLGSIFVDRRAGKIQETMEKLRTALQSREVVSLFPESTTGNGIRTLSFKPGFFNLAEAPIAGVDLVVQPATLIYTHLSGLPIDSCQWPKLAWYGDMLLVPHVWELLKLGRIDVTLEFLPPASSREHGGRKGLAAHCHRAVSGAIEKARNEA
jgi:1-acyl-sn-glycerol-3-phosphate acyltransferase